MQRAIKKNSMTLEQAVGQQFSADTFEGREAPPNQFLEVLRRQHVGGLVLFRHKNVGNLAELRGLTDALQRAAAESGQPPLLIAADQEGGQLIAVDQTTPFPGNMALGAAGSESSLARWDVRWGESFLPWALMLTSRRSATSIAIL